jgi:hypothetical protein
VTTIETLVLDARWRPSSRSCPTATPLLRAAPVSTIALPWPASAARRHHVLLDELGR